MPTHEWTQEYAANRLQFALPHVAHKQPAPTAILVVAVDSKTIRLKWLSQDETATLADKAFPHLSQWVVTSHAPGWLRALVCFPNNSVYAFTVRPHTLN